MEAAYQNAPTVIKNTPIPSRAREQAMLFQPRDFTPD
jgi:hypothetical protein